MSTQPSQLSDWAPALLLELHPGADGEFVLGGASGGAWLESRGLSPAALRESPQAWFEWVAEGDREALARTLRQTLPGAPPSWCELRLRGAEGPFWVVSSWSAGPDPRHGMRLLGLVFDWHERHEAEARHRENEKRWRELLENAHDLIYIHDLQGRFTFVNEAGARLTGFTRDELLAMGMDVVIAPEYYRTAKENIALKLRDPHRETYYELEVVAKDGHRIPLEVNTRLIWKNGKPVGVQGIARDLTERKRAQDELVRTSNELENIMSTIADAVYVIDMDSKLARWNRSVEVITGLGPEVLKGRPALEFFREEDRQPVAEAIGRVVSEGRARVEARLLRSDGSTVPFEFYGAALRDAGGQVIGVTGVGRDVSEQSSIREALAQHAKALARSNEELEDFAQIVSHDLKAPLRHIHNYATFVLEDHGEKIGAEGREQLEALRRIPVRMQALVDTLLEYSRLGRIDDAVGPVDLQAVVAQVLDDMRPTFEERAVEVKLARPLPRIICDRARVATVFLNLVSNAVKYNDKSERRVEIGWEDGASAAGMAKTAFPVFYVRDNGIGIRAKDLEKIFRIFRRLHGRDEYGGGQGAGLAIVKKIVEHHGGRIWAESCPDEGTTLRFTLGARAD